MKKYKTWEAFKMLTENPKLQFKLHVTDNIKRILKCRDDYFFCLEYMDGKLTPKENYGGNFNGNVSLDEEWTLINQEVSFTHAIEEWQNGKTIYCILSNTKIIYNHEHDGLLVDQNEHPMSSIEMSKGHWYINED